MANLLLDDLNQELERGGHCLCRYADDGNIYVQSLTAGQPVMESVGIASKSIQRAKEKIRQIIRSQFVSHLDGSPTTATRPVGLTLLDSSSTWALRRRSPIAWLLPVKVGGVSLWLARCIRRCRRTGSQPKGSRLWSASMTRYNIEETAVYDKYVRWCGRTGSRGPSYPIPRERARPL